MYVAALSSFWRIKLRLLKACAFLVIYGPSREYASRMSNAAALEVAWFFINVA